MAVRLQDPGEVLIPRTDFAKWLEALRSGKYKQTTGRLQDSKGFCCLGVACDVLIPQDKKKMSTAQPGMLRGGMPTVHDQPNAPQWLRELSLDFANKTGVTLPALNDGTRIEADLSTIFPHSKYNTYLTGSKQRFSFLELADLLELVYVDKVLEVS